MNAYASALAEAMAMLSLDPKTIFLGQTVVYPGTAMHRTLANVPVNQKLEFPVAEETQMGASIGLALSGLLPVSIFTRWNFMLLATNQLVNHLDKIPLYSGYRPKVIIRTGVGSEYPMYPGPQHTGDYTDTFSRMCKTVKFVRLDSADMIMPAYWEALRSEFSTVLVEISDLYND